MPGVYEMLDAGGSTLCWSDLLVAYLRGDSGALLPQLVLALLDRPGEIRSFSRPALDFA